ncbi:hypothetical protein PR048_000465 [Dryococelus australis]|uniref:Uncharacterized protein n=1 Tax=Dryococelus australis TaxID=614101 RepID=A0ABQ9IEP2_9NEOP|nr:hypothetical protein PR048_000465 [Dryococelus australis]
MKVGVENKLYCRERSKEMLYRGRIRVQLKNDDGTLVNPDFPTHYDAGEQGFSRISCFPCPCILALLYFRLVSPSSALKTLSRAAQNSPLYAQNSCGYVAGDSVMLYLGQMIPKLKSRMGKQGGADQGQAQPSGGTKKKTKSRR